MTDLKSLASSLQAEIEKLGHELRSKKNELAALYRTCRHEWGPVRYDPIRTQGYRVEGDPPGTMGIDRQLPYYVEPKETPRWIRECRVCGLVEKTERFEDKTHVEKVPSF